MHEIATILLAAGLSRRMGEQNKLLLPIHGRPMIAHMVAIYQAATKGPVLVVTGNERALIEEALDGSGAETVFSENYKVGQVNSVACGLQNAPDAKTLLMALGDQPYLQTKDLQALLAAHDAADPNRISIPQIGDMRGTPLVIPGALRARLLEDPRSPGCKRFTRENPEHVQFHALPARGFYDDIDTPEDYAALLADLEKEDA